MSQQIDYSKLCGAVKRDGDSCSRRATAGKTMCKQHAEVSEREDLKAIAKQAQLEKTRAFELKWQEERRQEAIKAGTPEQRAKFRRDVLEAWRAAREPEPILRADEDAYQGYNSDLEVDEDGVGECSVCDKVEYCVKTNHGNVYCSDDCLDRHYDWVYMAVDSFPREIPEEYRK